MAKLTQFDRNLVLQKHEHPLSIIFCDCLKPLPCSIYLFFSFVNFINIFYCKRQCNFLQIQLIVLLNHPVWYVHLSRPLCQVTRPLFSPFFCEMFLQNFFFTSLLIFCFSVAGHLICLIYRNQHYSCESIPCFPHIFLFYFLSIFPQR